MPNDTLQKQSLGATKNTERKRQPAHSLHEREQRHHKSIGKALTDLEDLKMIEAVGNYTGQKLGATFF